MNAWTLLEATTGNRRDELAKFWINAPDDALEHLWKGPIGDATKNLIGQISTDTQFSQEQLQLRGQLAQRLQQGLLQPGVLKLMIACFLFIPPGKLRVKNPETNFPAWLLPDYRSLYQVAASPAAAPVAAPAAVGPQRVAFPTSLQGFASDRIQLNRLLGLANLYYIDPEDQEILQELRDLRLKLSELILAADAGMLEAAFCGELGDRYVALLRSGIQKEALQPAEEALKQRWMAALPDWPQVDGSLSTQLNHYIVAMAYVEPAQWQLSQPEQQIPAWLYEHYHQLVAKPTLS